MILWHFWWDFYEFKVILEHFSGSFWDSRRRWGIFLPFHGILKDSLKILWNLFRFIFSFGAVFFKPFQWSFTLWPSPTNATWINRSTGVKGHQTGVKSADSIVIKSIFSFLFFLLLLLLPLLLLLLYFGFGLHRFEEPKPFTLF